MIVCRDLRKISTKDAGMMLVAMGDDPLDVKGLKRWDRVSRIRELATKAEQVGTGEALHRLFADIY